MFTEATRTSSITLPLINSPLKKNWLPNPRFQKGDEKKSLSMFIKKEHPATTLLVDNLRDKVSFMELSGYQSDKKLAKIIMQIACMHLSREERFDTLSEAEISLVVTEIVSLVAQAHLVMQAEILKGHLLRELPFHSIRRIARSTLEEHIAANNVDRLVSGGWKRDAMRRIQENIKQHIQLT